MTRLFDPPSAPPFHLSEDALTRAVCQELSRAQELLSKEHLNRCHKCVSRFDLLARTTLEIAEHHRRVMQQLEPLPPVWRDRFIQELDILLESVPSRHWRRPLQVRRGARPFGRFETSLKGVLVAICASFVLFLVWHRRQPVQSAEFLDHMMASGQSPAMIASSRVIDRRSRAKTSKKVIGRSTYRSISGHREQRHDKAHDKYGDLAAGVAFAGVNWDDPLSAASFKRWHDRQLNPINDVYASGEGLPIMNSHLLSTNSAHGSLTLRKDGFRPVEGNIDYHEIGAVEFSEVSSEFPSVGKANQPFSLPELALKAAAPMVPARPLLPSMKQLNESELQTRLLLSQKNADSGEQIEINRDAKGVYVQGLVEGEERKKELNESLQAIPFLSVSIQSFDDLSSTDHPVERVPPSQQESAVALVSPLEQYFVQQGRSRGDLTRISAGLFNSSLAINRSSRSIKQVELRFSADEALSPAAIHARDELLSRTVERLLTDLNAQQHFLDEAGLDYEWSPRDPGNSHADSVELANLAEQNNKITRELISGAGKSHRSQKALATDLAETILLMRTAALNIVPSLSIK